MNIEYTNLREAVVITMNPNHDQRGYFSRNFCKRTFESKGIDFNIVQVNTAFNKYKHTLRGMHFQLPPFSEQKMIMCTTGAIFDVIIDLNKDSLSYGQYFGIELSADNNKALYVPKGFAHGYLTLTESTTINYLVSEYYTPEKESGVRWNDPSFQINWPVQKDLIISDKDKQWRNFDLNDDGLFTRG